MNCLVGFKALAYITRVLSAEAYFKEEQVPHSEDVAFFTRFFSKQHIEVLKQFFVKRKHYYFITILNYEYIHVKTILK